MANWQRGDVVVVRHAWRGRVWFAHPAIVVAVEATQLVLFEPVGSIRQWSYFDHHAGKITPPMAKVRIRNDALMVIKLGAAHAVSLLWNEGRFVGWYVDMQKPIRRVVDGFVTWDQALDIVVAPDLSWRWKDEDHLARSVELGWMTAEEAQKVRQEGGRVIERIEQRAAPFDDSWTGWRPDPGWPIPHLTSDWARP